MHPIVHIWNKAPFLRLLFPMIAGIISHWYLKFPIDWILIPFCICIFSTIIYFFLSLKSRFRLASVHGILINIMMICAGAILVELNDVRDNEHWIGNNYKDSSFIIAKIEEPLVLKPNSFKALATISSVNKNGNWLNVSGKIIIYFKKDSSLKILNYGSRIIFNKPLSEIKNAGNPGSFNYKEYSLFQGICHQVYLLPNEFHQLDPDRSVFRKFIFDCRDWVLDKLRKNIKGKKEQGLSEALLIGYKDDLDKDLVQSYSNTGVVHVIAISGLHLGLIYWLLLIITKPLARNLSLLRLLLIITTLWWFSILAGAQPSVLRSAVMFSFLAAAEVLSRRSSIFNTLALSAFALLCYNPFWLWDVGFQLSYSAVLSIVIFFQPIYNWFYFKNKILDFIWKLNAVTIAAQLLTLPICIYHFHQFPTLFLFTNLVAVPLSSLILIGEIILCVLSFFHPLAEILGSILEWNIWLMNSYIERLDQIPFSVWDGLSINFPQVILLSAFMLSFSFWLMDNKRLLFWFSIACFFCFILLHSVSYIISNDQKKLIVYNISKHTAVDLISGTKFRYKGDSSLQSDLFNNNFHLKPSRTLHRLSSEKNISVSNDIIFHQKRILFIDSSLRFKPVVQKEKVDLLIVSGNPRLYVSNLNNCFSIGKLIIDGSVPSWKARLWKKDCDSLSIPCFDVSEKGAFVMNF